jgi:hypothetical protein
VTELELRLQELGTAIAFPETPDLTAGVRGRLARQHMWWRRRALLVAVAVLVVAVAGVLAVPSARSALLEWLGIRGVEVRLVDELPARPVTRELDLGGRVTFGQAARSVPFRLLPPPDGLEDAPAIYLRTPPADGMVTYLYGTPARARMLLSQFRGEYEPFISKFADDAARLERLEIAGESALWLEGAHLLAYRHPDGTFSEEPFRLADNVLLWQHRGVTFRLEGSLRLDQARRVAELVVGETR